MVAGEKLWFGAGCGFEALFGGGRGRGENGVEQVGEVETTGFELAVDDRDLVVEILLIDEGAVGHHGGDGGSMRSVGPGDGGAVRPGGEVERGDVAFEQGEVSRFAEAAVIDETGVPGGMEIAGVGAALAGAELANLDGVAAACVADGVEGLVEIADDVDEHFEREGFFRFRRFRGGKLLGEIGNAVDDTVAPPGGEVGLAVEEGGGAVAIAVVGFFRAGDVDEVPTGGFGVLGTIVGRRRRRRRPWNRGRGGI